MVRIFREVCGWSFARTPFTVLYTNHHFVTQAANGSRIFRREGTKSRWWCPKWSLTWPSKTECKENNRSRLEKLKLVTLWRRYSRLRGISLDSLSCRCRYLSIWYVVSGPSGVCSSFLNLRSIRSSITICIIRKPRERRKSNDRPIRMGYYTKITLIQGQWLISQLKLVLKTNNHYIVYEWFQHCAKTPTHALMRHSWSSHGKYRDSAWFTDTDYENHTTNLKLINSVDWWVKQCVHCRKRQPSRKRHHGSRTGVSEK